MRPFEELIEEGRSVPVEGWDFSWFAGRATEERPSWGYARLMGERMRGARSALDVQTGGGEVLAGIPVPPARLVATESWRPNLALAARRLAALGASGVAGGGPPRPPVGGRAFGLLVRPHPTGGRGGGDAPGVGPGGGHPR